MKKFLATEIDKFCQNFDLYEYHDTNSSAYDIYNMISNNIFDVIAFFEFILNDDNNDEDILNHAKMILNDLYYYQRGELI